MQNTNPNSKTPSIPQIGRSGRYWRLSMSQWLPLPPDELFKFFGDAMNLQEITPDLLSFKVVTPAPIDMKPGALIDYKLRVRGIPLRWRTRIATWDPPHRFTDEQLKGPYARWHHTHTFTAENSGTRCEDIVEYRPRGGPLAPLINRLFVQGDVAKIFAYRAKVLDEKFGGRE